MKNFEMKLYNAYDINTHRHLQRLDILIANSDGKFEHARMITIPQEQSHLELADLLQKLAEAIKSLKTS